jgi:hypothetical protein
VPLLPFPRGLFLVARDLVPQGFSPPLFVCSLVGGSRVEELALKWLRGREEEESPAAEADAARVLSSMYEVSAVASRVWFLHHRFRGQFVGNFSTFTITGPGLGC